MYLQEPGYDDESRNLSGVRRKEQDLLPIEKWESLGKGSPDCHLMTSGGVASGIAGEGKKFDLTDL